jgi:hypothetical protein
VTLGAPAAITNDPNEPIGGLLDAPPWARR